MNTTRFALQVLLLTLLVSCTGKTREDVDPSHLDAGGDGDTDTDSDSDSDSDSDTDDYDCSDEAKLVYVVDTDAKLWRFNPPAKSFHLVGGMPCESGGSPFSMAVGRNDTAYVLYWDGFECVALNAVSIMDANCDQGATPFDCNNSAGFQRFGMGFATDGPDTNEETLFIGRADGVTTQLASLDIDTWQIDPIGPIADAPELTGNQNGELWAYFAWATTPKVAQLDKTTGDESNVVYMEELTGIAAFAFAYWGGDFYLFHAPQDEFTTVHRLAGGATETEVWVPGEETGIVVVGAGVSTCAPTTIE